VFGDGTGDGRLKSRARVRTIRNAMSAMASEELPLVVTDSAVRRIRVLQQKESRPEASLRLRIIAGGCSGMQYRMDLADAPRSTDLVVSAQNVRVLVDPKSMNYLKGSKLEWEEDLFGGQFKITNPNAKHSCSCGLSFTI
jgi:iron-sulfur cluster assembly protein